MELITSPADAYVFAFRRNDGKWAVVNDVKERIVLTRRPMLASAFEQALSARMDAPLITLIRNPMQIAQLILTVHVAATDVKPHVRFIEDEEFADPLDAVWHAAEIAKSIPFIDSPGDAIAVGYGRAS